MEMWVRGCGWEAVVGKLGFGPRDLEQSIRG